MLPRAFLREKEFDAEVKRVEKLPGDRVDSTGDPCVKFRIVLPDSADTNARLIDWTREIRNVIEDEFRSGEHWGVNSYYRYRLQSEQETMRTPAWA